MMKVMELLNWFVPLMIGAPDYTKYNVSIFLFNTLVSLNFFEAKGPEVVNPYWGTVGPKVNK